MYRMWFSAAALSTLVALFALGACKPKQEPTPRFVDPDQTPPTEPTPPPQRAEPSPPAPAKLTPPTTFDAVPRMEFNRWAVRTNTPLYWIADANSNQTIDADEIAPLLFYPTTIEAVKDGKLTPAFTTAYQAIWTAWKQGPSKDERERLVGEDLDQGRPTLVHTDASKLSQVDRTFIANMQKVGALVDELYELQNGSSALASKLPPDAASRSLFRRNRGPRCVGPTTEGNPKCTAVPGAKVIFDLYPADLQADEKFCEKLEARPDAKTVLQDHFAVVRGQGDQLKAVPYTEAYKAQMTAISDALVAAADQMTDPKEKALVTYLRAAAKSFKTNEWVSADTAWAAMGVDNSAWYVRIAPDEVYWEPCSQKAGLHLTFARINQDSKRWQSKLVPVRQEMETKLAQLAGPPYKARNVKFKLPDFIDIVINAGDDRDALGATIGQSLPNWGAVAEKGGRTVAMTNLYADVDSRDARKLQAESLLDAESMKRYAPTTEPGLANTILHEAMHNLGPAHDYKVAGKTAGAVFTGPIASVMEELKAQTGALWLLEFLRGKKLIEDRFAQEAYADAIVWAFGHISQGMYAGTGGQRKTYSQVSAVQIGFLLEKGVLVWDPQAKAANGSDTGAFHIHYDKLVPAVTDMMKLVAGIKARGDAKAANELLAKYVDGPTVPHAVIKERFLRHPKASFVYAIK